MKRVLLITTTPFFREKGSSLRIFSIAKILSKECAVDLVTYPLGKDIVIPNLKIYRTPSFFKPQVGVSKISISKIILDFFIFLKCIFLITNNDYDVIQCEDFEAAFIGRVLSLFLFKKIFFVYDLHNRIVDNLNFKGLLKKAVISIEVWVIKIFDLIIVNWEKYLSDDVFSGKKKILFYDRIDLNSERLESKEVSGNYIIYSGNFMPYQGVKEFINVFSKINSDLRLVLVGECSQEIFDLIKSLNLESKIIVMGLLPIAQTNFLIQKSVMGVLPRVSGKSPSMKMIHYLIMGKPVLATDLPCNQGILKDGYNGFFYNNDSKLKEIIETRKYETSLLEEGIRDTKNKLLEFYKDEYLLSAYG